MTESHVATFFAALAVLSVLFLYLAACRKFGYGSIGSIGTLLVLLGVLHPYFEGALLKFESPPIYYPYFPLRVVCGALFLWFVPFYLSRRGFWLALLGYAAAGASALWNSDTGIVILVAWTATLVFDDVARGELHIGRVVLRVGLHGLCFLLTLLLAFGGYAVFARLRGGRFPDFSAFTKYQSIYYGSGFMMLPMKLWELWQPIILIYAVTVFLAVRKLFARTADATTAWYFFIRAFRPRYLFLLSGPKSYSLPNAGRLSSRAAGVFFGRDAAELCRSVRLWDVCCDGPARRRAAGRGDVLAVASAGDWRFFSLAAEERVGRDAPVWHAACFGGNRCQNGDREVALAAAKRIVFSPVADF